MAADEMIVAALLDEDEEHAGALVERVRGGADHAQLDPLEHAIARDRYALDLGGGMIGGLAQHAPADQQALDRVADATLVTTRAAYTQPAAASGAHPIDQERQIILGQRVFGF